MELSVKNGREWAGALRKLHDLEEAVIIRFEEGSVVEADDEGLIFCRQAVHIIGNGAVLRGRGDGNAICLTGQNIAIENLSVEGFFMGICLRAAEHPVKHVLIRGCSFRDITSECISAGIKKSGGLIEDVIIEDCLFEAPRRERGGHCSTATNVATALYTEEDERIHHVTLREVKWRRNRLVPNPVDGNLFSLGFTAHGCCNHAFYENMEMEKSAYHDVSDSLQENIYIEDNEIDGVYDIGISALTALGGQGISRQKHVLIAGNRICYNNTAINVGTANIPCYGRVSGHSTRDVVIRDNVCIPREPGPFEPQIAIMLFTVRAESLLIECTDCEMSDVTVTGNEITGRDVGIALQAVHGNQDLPNPSRLAGISLKNVKIIDNVIRQAERPLRIFTAKLEGRVDDFWGYVLPPYDPALPFSTRCENCTIDDICVMDNTLIEYDCALTMGAAWGCGHGYIRGCTLGPDLVFSGNRLDGGRKVFCYDKYITDSLLYDEAISIDSRVIGHFDIRDKRGERR